MSEAKKYAVVRRWKDNPRDLQVVEYFSTVEEGNAYIKTQPKSAEYSYEVMKYE